MANITKSTVVRPQNTTEKKVNGNFECWARKKAAQPNRLNMETLVSAVQKPFDCIPFKTIYSRFKYALFMSISPALVYTRDALCVWARVEFVEIL